MSVNGKKRFEAIDTEFLIKQSGMSSIDWTALQSKPVLYSRLLELEKKILLHPSNGQHLFMPVVDDIIASEETGVYGKIYVKTEGNPAKDSTDIINSLMPHTQVKNGIIFVKGKFGVGIVALAITGHSTSQADDVELNKFYFDAIEGETRDTMLRFEGLEDNYGLNNYTDNNGNIITEFLSQLLTTQVDNVKNPVGIKLGINNQTLNIVEYLNRRGVEPETIIAFIKQPLIQEYLIAQRINESIIYKSNNLEVKKTVLIDKILSKYYKPEQIKDVTFPDTAFIKKQNLLNSIKNKQIDINQLHYFNYFLELLNQSRALSDFSQEQTSDTKSIKNKTGYEQIVELKAKSEASEIVPLEKQIEVRTNGVIAPFTKARENYRTKFNDMYITNHPDIKSTFTNLKGQLVRLQKTKNKKERVGTTFENDFILYFAMKHVLPGIDANYYNNLFGLSNEDSLVSRVKDAQETFPNNIVLNAFLPLLKTRVDEYTDKYLDNLRLFEREINNADANDLINSMKEIAEQDFNLYRDLIVFSLMQSGFNNSPFNYLKIVPVGLQKNRDKVEEFEYVLNDIMNDTLKAIYQSIGNATIQQEIMQYFDEFQRNNPQYLRKNSYKGYPMNYTIGFKQGKMELYRYNPENYKDKPQVAMLGSTYHKRYGLDNTAYIRPTDVEQSEDKVTTPKIVTTQPVVNQLKVISGGQTGVDVLGLEIAKELGIQTGGTVTKGFKQEDSSNPELATLFGVVEISDEQQRDYTKRTGKKDPYTGRTELNVRNSDGTVYFNSSGDNAGLIATERAAKEWKKPFIVNPTGEELNQWMSKNNIQTLNVAGNRGSKLTEEKRDEIADTLRTAFFLPLNVKQNSQQLELFDNAKQLKVEKDEIAERMNADFNELFPQYEYFTEEQKKTMATVVANNETPIECKFGS